MAGDPTRDILLADLRRLRRTPGELTQERIAAGDVDQAYAVLMKLLEQHEDDQDGDILAFFYTCGWTIAGDTLDIRLKRYAEMFHVQERTALRRSDRGAFKLASLVRHRLNFDRPLARIFTFQNGPSVRAWVEVTVEESSDWSRPRVYIQGERVEGLEFPLNRPGFNDRYLSSLERLPDTALDPSVDEFESLVSIRVSWSMPIWPSWDLTSHIVDDRLYARLQVDRAGTAEVGICWINEYAIGSSSGPFKEAEVFPRTPDKGEI